MAISFAHADQTDINPVLYDRLNKLANNEGQDIYIDSGKRSYEKQAELYQAYLNGTGNLAAAPGTSRHETGNAVDINNEWFTALDNDYLSQFGLIKNVDGENWHVEAIDGWNGGGGSVATAIPEDIKQNMIASRANPSQPNTVNYGNNGIGTAEEIQIMIVFDRIY